MRPFYAAAFPKKSHVPSWNWKGNLTPFLKPQKLPKISVPTWEECWVSHHNSRRALFSPPQLEMTVDYAASSVKESQCCCHPSRGGQSHLETRVHSRELCLNSKRPRFPHPLQIRLIPLHWLDCNPEYRLKTWTEVWQHQGTSRKSPRFLCQLDRKPDSPFTPREGRGVPCLHMKWGLTPLLKLHRNPEIHVRTEEEHLGSSLNSRWGPMPCTNWRGIPRAPLQLEWRLDFPEATQVGPWGPCSNWRGTPSFLPQLEKTQEILLSTRDQVPFHCSISREIPPSLLRLETVLETP